MGSDWERLGEMERWERWGETGRDGERREEGGDLGHVSLFTTIFSPPLETKDYNNLISKPSIPSISKFSRIFSLCLVRKAFITKWPEC